MPEKVSYEFDPFELAGVDPPKDEDKRQEAMNKIGEYVVAEVLGYCADGNTPVSGGSWKRTLSKKYREYKENNGGQGFANMELTGDMLNALECPEIDDTTLSLQIVGAEAPKADGHNNHSGASTLPARDFIPKADQTFKAPIIRGIRQIAEEFADEQDNG